MCLPFYRAPGGRCLVSRYFGGEFACQCHNVECDDDLDCGAGKVCACGSFAHCDGISAKSPCGNKCVPATCATSADCDPGGICSPTWDLCGVAIQAYHCHYPAKDECLTSFECPPNHDCLYEGYAWGCVDSPTCE